MSVLVVGASGATGRLLVKQLLDRDQKVKVIVRPSTNLNEVFTQSDKLKVIQGSLLDLSVSDITHHIEDCDAVASCLGHNLSFRGIYGHPRRLVTNATQRLCDAIKTTHPSQAIRFVLMNTAGNSNRDLDESISFQQKCIIWLLRHLLPPHADNEQAADFLRIKIGQQNKLIEWVAVRPDGLIDEAETSPYEIFPSPTRSPIFDPGSTSRVNVASFMADLITSDDLWSQWQGRMPVIYNKT